MKILVVEDEEKMSRFIVKGLTEEDYEVTVAHDGEEAWQKIQEEQFELAIMDWMLPKMDGVTLCGKVREANMKMPIIMLTVRDSVEDKILGLDKGADDYLTKPFHFDELLARIRALSRRPRDIQEEATLQCGHLTMDLLKRRVWVGDQEVSFSQKEFALLEFLIRKRGEVISRGEIAEKVWGTDFDPMSNTIDVYINFLRKKIDGRRGESHIETIRGVGYRLVNM